MLKLIKMQKKLLELIIHKMCKKLSWGFFVVAINVNNRT